MRRADSPLILCLNPQPRQMSTCRRRTIQFSKIIERQAWNRFRPASPALRACLPANASGILGKKLDELKIERPTQHPKITPSGPTLNQNRRLPSPQIAILSHRSPCAALRSLITYCWKGFNGGETGRSLIDPLAPPPYVAKILVLDLLKRNRRHIDRSAVLRHLKSLTCLSRVCKTYLTKNPCHRKARVNSFRLLKPL